MAQGTTGNDKIVGTADGDYIDFSQGGHDTVQAAGGDDTLIAGGSLDAGDRIDGGAGQDNITLDGDYSAGLAISPTVLKGVEAITLGAGNTYALTFADGDYQLETARLIVQATDGYQSVLDVDASAVTTTGFDFTDDRGADRILGGALSDEISLRFGGNDTVDGGGGNDSITVSAAGDMHISGGDGDDSIGMSGTFTTADQIDGGAGYDRLYLQDSFGSLNGATLTGANIKGVEDIRLTPDGMSVHLILADSLATPDLQGGQLSMSVEGYDISVSIDGSAERDTSLALVGGGGDDQLLGGAVDDTFYLNALGNTQDGGNDTASGGGGADTFLFTGTTLNGKDRIDGGAGRDTVQLSNAYGAAIKLAAGTLTSIETIKLQDAFQLTLNDGNVAAGGRLSIDGSSYAGSVGMLIDGSAETDGRLYIAGGAGGDTLHGGALSDTIVGGAGADKLTGGAGADHFVFHDIADSAPGASDLITDLDNADEIDLSGIDARISQDGDQHFKLVHAFTGREGQAVLSYDSKTQVTTLSLDVNGDGVSDADIRLRGDHTDFSHFAL